LLLLSTYFGARAYGEIERRQAVAAFGQAQTEPLLPQSPDRPLPQSSVRLAPVNVQVATVTAPIDSAAESAESSAPAALLRIRRVGLEVPVYADTSERNLNRGAGLIEGTSAPQSDGNSGIAAHRDGYFRVLADVVLGDVLDLETSAGKRSYRVTGLSIVEPTDLSPLDATDLPAVTLVTCYPFYFVGPAPLRYIVRAVAVD